MLHSYRIGQLRAILLCFVSLVGAEFALNSYEGQNCTQLSNLQYATGGYTGVCTNTPSGSVNVTCTNGSWILSEYTLSNCYGENVTTQGYGDACTVTNKSNYLVQCLPTVFSLPQETAMFGQASDGRHIPTSFGYANYTCQMLGTTNATDFSDGGYEITIGCPLSKTSFSPYYFNCTVVLNMSQKVYFYINTIVLSDVTIITGSTAWVNGSYFHFQVSCNAKMVTILTPTPTLTPFPTPTPTPTSSALQQSASSVLWCILLSMISITSQFLPN